MQNGEFARYKNTGTVGKVVSSHVEGGVEWVELDNKLVYDASYLETGLGGRVSRCPPSRIAWKGSTWSRSRSSRRSSSKRNGINTSPVAVAADL